MVVGLWVGPTIRDRTGYTPKPWNDDDNDKFGIATQYFLKISCTVNFVDSNVVVEVVQLYLDNTISMAECRLSEYDKIINI